jgi:hypothetical protein
MDHCRTRAGGTDDRIGIALFENADKAPGHEACFIEISGIECRLRAASLSLIKLNLTPDPSQHLDTAHADTGPHLIDETRDEKRDLHNESISRG